MTTWRMRFLHSSTSAETKLRAPATPRPSRAACSASSRCPPARCLYALQLTFMRASLSEPTEEGTFPILLRSCRTHPVTRPIVFIGDLPDAALGHGRFHFLLLWVSSMVWRLWQTSLLSSAWCCPMSKTVPFCFDTCPPQSPNFHFHGDDVNPLTRVVVMNHGTG